MPEYSELGELAPRDVVSRAISLEMEKSGKEFVYLDMRRLDSGFLRSRFPNIHEACLNFGVDITKDLVPVAPAAHYTIGGVKTGLSGETNVRGLLACGEVACTGVHGANRLASNSLLECIVFAKRAVDGALSWMQEYSSESGVSADLSDVEFVREQESLYNECRAACSRLMNRSVGIVRNEKSLADAMKELERMTNVVDKLSGFFKLKLDMVLDVSTLITRFSLLREESRGVHIREDFPLEDPAWKKHIIIKRGEEPRTEEV
jgi:L-aspartate oxidase